MTNVFIKKYWDEEDILFYLHYRDGEAIRQIEISPEGKTFLSASNPDDYTLLANQPLEETDYEPGDFITEEQFETVWNQQ